MSAIKESRVTSIVRFWINLALILIGLLGLFLLIDMVRTPFLLKDRTRDVSVSVPVFVGENSLLPLMPVRVQADGGAAIASPHLVGAKGELRFRTTNWQIKFIT